MRTNENARICWMYARNIASVFTRSYRSGWIHSGVYDGVQVFRAATIDNRIIGYWFTERSARKAIREYETEGY